MKRIHRILSLALAALMVLSCLTACGGTPKKEDPPKTSDPAPTTQAPEDAPAAPAAPAKEASYPLSDEPVTLTVYMRDQTRGVANYDTIKGFQAAFDKLGVNVEFIIPAAGSEADQFNLMIGSGEYPDIILWNFATTPMSLNEMVDEGVLIDMDSYIRQYAPNYLAIMEAHPEYAKEGTADDGHMKAMYTFNETVPVSYGNGIRADLLEKYNLEMPATVDDWTNVLTALKDAGAAEYPLTTCKNATGNVWLSGFMPAYKTASTFCLDDKTGEVVYGPATDNFKQYLTKMIEWYQAGLIDPEFVVNDNAALSDKLASGRNAAGTSILLSGHISNTNKVVQKTNPEFNLVGTNWPVLNAGDAPAFIGTVYYSEKQAAITTACSDPVLATRFLDYLYSEEGQNYMSWGIEGESYVVNADGSKSFTDQILKNPDGKSPTEAILEYANPQYIFATMYQNAANNALFANEPIYTETKNMWSGADTGVNLPRLVVAPENQSDYSMTFNDISTYAQEMYIKFLTGKEDLESGWDNYVKTLNLMGLETVTQYMADAYARFQNR